MRIFVFALIIFLVSCADTKNNKLIIGSWRGVEWKMENNSAMRDASQTFFSFDEKGQYGFEYNGRMEKGSYKVENDMLFTRPEGEQEIMVKILKLTNDSLVFGMNRGGDQEVLTLIRK